MNSVTLVCLLVANLCQTVMLMLLSKEVTELKKEVTKKENNESCGL